jgi:hypothetical protein
MEVLSASTGQTLDNYLVTWLSFVGPNVGLGLDYAYAAAAASASSDKTAS